MTSVGSFWVISSTATISCATLYKAQDSKVSLSSPDFLLISIFTFSRLLMITTCPQLPQTLVKTQTRSSSRIPTLVNSTDQHLNIQARKQGVLEDPSHSTHPTPGSLQSTVIKHELLQETLNRSTTSGHAFSAPFSTMLPERSFLN